MIPVAVVESEQNRRETLCHWVDSSLECRCVLRAASSKGTLLEASSERPAVALVNAQLSGESGLDCAARLIQLAPSIRVIMLSSEERPEPFFEALRRGACGYLLLERLNQWDVVRAIVEAQNGGTPMTSIFARHLVDLFCKPPASIPDLSGLSPREIEVLGHLSSGLSNKELAAHLQISYETACVHLRRIYAKLQVRSRTEAILRYFEAQRSPKIPVASPIRSEVVIQNEDRLHFLTRETVRLATELQRYGREIAELQSVSVRSPGKARTPVDHQGARPVFKLSPDGGQNGTRRLCPSSFPAPTNAAA